MIIQLNTYLKKILNFKKFSGLCKYLLIEFALLCSYLIFYKKFY